jgi:hypothetical protein
VGVRKTSRKRVSKRPEIGMLWTRYRDDKTSRQAYELLSYNYVNSSYTRGITVRGIVELMAAKAVIPIPIESLCEELTGPLLSRGGVVFGYVGKFLDELAESFPDMYWWISDVGLNFKVLPPDVPELSAFDQLAGGLTVENWANGKLLSDAVPAIADALDNAGFSVSDELQPAQWKAIAEHNQKYSRRAVKTFRDIVLKPTFVRFFKKRLYTARDRFLAAQPRKALTP